jgi:hypothetical protein
LNIVTGFANTSSIENAECGMLYAVCCITH